MSNSSDATDDLDDLDADLLLALVDEAPASLGVRQALLTALAGPWWAPFVRRAAALLDIDANETSALMAAMDDADRWLAGPGEGIELFHIDAGPAVAVAGAITGFVRLGPGAVFPHHRHVGFEDVLVLAGALSTRAARSLPGWRHRCPRPHSIRRAAAPTAASIWRSAATAWPLMVRNPSAPTTHGREACVHRGSRTCTRPPDVTVTGTVFFLEPSPLVSVMP